MADRFDPPLLVDDEFGPREICCALDAIEFLEEWPLQQRCKLHRCATEACCAAYDGRMSVGDARAAFEIWARMAHIAVTRQFEAVRKGEIFEIC
ncbi:MAG: DUF982 domain-containing protein [Mesorhizobium sp.]|uniref:DUF982 domain-containing protein n=1 Tax=Mesorhizobium sp. TaxID=1871066 RepID=UPI000FEAAF94|nr:DUF982 domain-containing protein [Mesorhizobium sp.]RWE81931.1 MAG: DUF982 domain-containing protein [Mesorhizobium sp.]TJW62286.1 MAG: DUF982 domain-containing protein [Mesorhizobium sp.]